MERINLDDFLSCYKYKYFSKEYHKLKHMLLTEKEKLDDIEFMIYQNDDIDKLFEEYMLADKEQLYVFLFNHPIFHKYIKKICRINEIKCDIVELADAFDIDKIRLFRDCTHVFGIINNRYTCLNCGLDENDLLIRDEDELITFKDMARLKYRFVGQILNEEMAYKSLIYDQKIEEIKIKRLKK